MKKLLVIGMVVVAMGSMVVGCACMKKCCGCKSTDKTATSSQPVKAETK
jgi:hypothetical protein